MKYTLIPSIALVSACAGSVPVPVTAPPTPTFAPQEVTAPDLEEEDQDEADAAAVEGFVAACLAAHEDEDLPMDCSVGTYENMPYMMIEFSADNEQSSGPAQMMFETVAMPMCAIFKRNDIDGFVALKDYTKKQVMIIPCDGSDPVVNSFEEDQTPNGTLDV